LSERDTIKTNNDEVVISKMNQITMSIKSADDETKAGSHFPEITFMLKPQRLDSYLEKITGYSFAATMVVMLAFFGMLNQIKLIAENQALANSLSLFSIGMNLVWNFFFFTVHFQLSIWGEYMQYLGLPAFWYFISSFTFESRLFIVVWRSQLTQQQIYDEQYMRRRLTLFYVLFYLSSFGVAIMQNWFLYDAVPLLLFNSTIWVPQIIKTFVERNRRGPPL
jgi:hypothetical protein